MTGTIARISAGGDVTVKGEVLQIPAALQGTGARNWVKDSERTIAVRSSTYFTFLSDLKEVRNRRVTVSVDVEVVNITTGGRLGFEPALNFVDGTRMYLNLWHYVSVGDSFTGRISKTFDIPDTEIVSPRQTGMYIQCDGDVTKLSNPMLVIGEETAPWRPAPEDFGVDWLPIWVQDFNNPVSFSDTGDMAVSGEVVEIPDEFKGTGGRNLLPNAADERTGGSEFLRHNDIAPILDHYGLRQYTFSFDIKAPVPGTVMVYLQNGSGARYTFSKNVTVTTEFSRLSVTTTPVASNLELSAAHLAFYGTYGTGRIPTVKNVKIEMGGQVTPHALAPEDLGVTWIPDWVQNFDNPLAVNNDEAGVVLGTLSETPDAIKFNGTSAKIDLSNGIVETADVREKGIFLEARAKVLARVSMRFAGVKPTSSYSDYATGGIGVNTSGYPVVVAYNDGGSYIYATGPDKLNIGETYIVSGGYDPADQKLHLYLNGEKVATSVVIGTYSRLNGNNANAIGYMPHGTDQRFTNGVISEVKIWNKTFTADEVRENLHVIPKGDEPDLVGYWRLNEGFGQVANDTSNNQFHGTLDASCEWVSSLD